MALHSKLSPDTRWLARTASPREIVSGLMEVSPLDEDDTSKFKARLSELGIRIVYWSPYSHMVSFEIPASNLAKLAEEPYIIYVETGNSFGTVE